MRFLFTPGASFVPVADVGHRLQTVRTVARNLRAWDDLLNFSKIKQMLSNNRVIFSDYRKPSGALPAFASADRLNLSVGNSS